MQIPGHRIWVGTSNIVIPGNKDSFPPPYNLKSRLHYYAFFFNSIEINQTFYKLPRPATFERWAAEVPGTFKFTVKLSKDITHVKDLKGELGIIDTFLYAAERLHPKEGCLLLQFPGKISLEYFNEVETVLEKVAAADEGRRWKKAVELRDSSWHTGETYELLNSFDATLVLHDMPKSRITQQVTAAPFVYIRFHGPKGDYRGSYTDDFLKTKAAEILDMYSKGNEIYVYFNNTIGNAFSNARLLIDLLSSAFAKNYE